MVQQIQKFRKFNFRKKNTKKTKFQETKAAFKNAKISTNPYQANTALINIKADKHHFKR